MFLCLVLLSKITLALTLPFLAMQVDHPQLQTLPSLAIRVVLKHTSSISCTLTAYYYVSLINFVAYYIDYGDVKACQSNKDDMDVSVLQTHSSFHFILHPHSASNPSERELEDWTS